MKRFPVYALFLTLVAFLLRVYRLDYFSLRGDEAFTVIFVQRTWEGLWRGISTIEPNPPLLYLLLRTWVFAAGTTEFVTRYFSAFFGVLCVPLLYRLAQEMIFPPLFGRRGLRSDFLFVPLFAAALVAINPYQIWHSQDVRNYTLWPALSLAALIFFWRWWRSEIRHRKRGARNWGLEVGSGYLVLFFLSTTLSLYTHYYDTFILLAENIFVFAFALALRKWQTLGRWVAAQITLVLVYAPWVLFGTNRITTYGEASAQQGVSLLEQFSRTIAAFLVGDTTPGNFRAMVWLPAALVLVATLIFLARKNLQPAAFLTLWLVIPSLSLYALSLGRPLFLERYLNGIAPAYYLAFAIALVSIYPPRAVWHSIAFSFAILWLATVPAYALANYWYDPNYAKAPDWRGLIQVINANMREGDIIVQNFNEVAPQYYRRGDAPVITVPRDYWWRSEDLQTLERVNKNYRRVWFIPAQPDWWDPQADALKFLSRYDDRVLQNDISIFHLLLFETPREFEPRITPFNAHIGSAVLSGYRVQKTGKAVTIVLYWRGAKIEKDLHVFVHLTKDDGFVVAQNDGVPVEGTYPTTAWKTGELIVDSYEIKTDAVGAFQMAIGMYDPYTGARVTALDGNGARLMDDKVLLTQISLP